MRRVLVPVPREKDHSTETKEYPMKRFSPWLTAAFCVALSGMTGANAANNWPKKPFDASYQVSSPSGQSTLRMATDGKGHLRSESSAANYNVVTLMDYTNSTQTSLIEMNKMAMQSKIPPEGAYIVDEESAKKANGKSLGSKVVGGHPCHGWSISSPGGTSEVWVADDIGCMVLSTSNGPAGKMKTELKKFSNTAPDASAFKVPAGYKLTTI